MLVINLLDEVVIHDKKISTAIPTPTNATCMIVPCYGDTNEGKIDHKSYTTNIFFD